MILIALWLVFASSSFGILGLNYLYARKAANGPWKIEINKRFSPAVSLIIPTYNEGEIISLKLRNLQKLEYPKKLLQMVFIDSKSTDTTARLIQEFVKQNPDVNAEVIVENERSGKSAALNIALARCTGDVIVISDADCFLPPGTLHKSLPYLADPGVGAISGPKTLLNAEDSWVTKGEDRYLKSANLIKLGDSKNSSTILFEGGFSAFKKKLIDKFDPYNTGSDDCGTVIGILEQNLRAIMVPEAEFFCAFPRDWRGKMEMKIRRANQLVRVLTHYAALLLKGRIRTGKNVVTRSLLTYLVAPILFLLLIVTTPFIALQFPMVLSFLLLFLVPKLGSLMVEAVLSYTVMIFSIVSATTRRRYLVWESSADRKIPLEKALLERQLI